MAGAAHLAVTPRIARALRWLRTNLFASWLNGALTCLGLLLGVLLLPPLFDWALWSAQWQGDSRQACRGDGACWVFVKAHLGQFLYGFYPESQRWRVTTALALAAAWAAPLFFARFRPKWLWGAGLLIGYPPLALLLFRGGAWGLPLVPTSDWGGLFLTLVLAGVGIACSLPLGILLALGRRSEMVITRSLCALFIEIWRGVPLITVLFMASVMLPLFLPEGLDLNKLLRALVGIVMFASAYMAEVVRGGLQAIPKSQYEAAAALGLSYAQQMTRVILPQALGHVIPGIVNTFIALFKDTTLVLIIGLFDLLGIVQAATTNPEWLGYALEGYVFCAALFWVFCYGMSVYSQRLERRRAPS